MSPDEPALVSRGVSRPTFYAQVDAFRRALLLETLRATFGRRAEAARRLALQRTYLAKLLRHYAIPKDYGRPAAGPGRISESTREETPR